MSLIKIITSESPEDLEKLPTEFIQKFKIISVTTTTNSTYHPRREMELTPGFFHAPYTTTTYTAAIIYE